MNKAEETRVPSIEIEEEENNELRVLSGMQILSELDRKVLYSFAILPVNFRCRINEIEQWFGFMNTDLDHVIQDGWLEYDEGSGTYSLQPLVRTIVRFDFTEDAERKKNIAPVGTTDKIMDYFYNHEELFDISRGYIPLQRMLDVIETVIGSVAKEETEHFAHLYHTIGNSYHDLCNYSKALEYYQNSFEIREKVLGTEHADTAISYNNIGSVFYAQGDYGKALGYYQKALAIRKKVLGNNHSGTATDYNNIGGVFKAQGDYDKALDYYQKALEIDVKVLGNNHPGTASDFNNIGGVFEARGDYSKALEYYLKAMEIDVKMLGNNHPGTATDYNNIGGVFEAQGDYGKALEYYLKALAIRKKVLGNNHSGTATDYNNIGGVFKAQGDYDKALDYYQKALEIDVKVLGNNHPGTASDFNNIGGVFEARGDYSKALEYYLKAMEIDVKMLGNNHPETATDYNNIGGVFEAQGDYGKALDYYQKALAIRKKVLGTEHPDTAASYNNIGSVYYAQGVYNKALGYYQKALTRREIVFGPRHPDTAQSYNSIGSVYFSHGDYEKALEYDFKALAIMEEVLGTEHPYTAKSYNSIGLVYKEQGDYSKALAYLNKAYQIYGKTLGPNHPFTNNVSEWITITTSISRGNKQKLPIGIQSFEILRKDKCVYVDKTQLLFDLVNDTKYVFLSRPRRFGKSLFMSTLKAYFEGKKELFEGLAISKMEKKWESFPILYLDLNVGKYDSAKGLWETLNSNLNDWEEEFGIKSNSTDVPALRFKSIIKKVAKIKNRNVVILVDEYDKPLLQAIDNESLQQQYRDDLKAFFSNLKTCDEYIHFAMLTGVSKFSKISLFSDLNNLNDISLNEHYFDICGLTDDEISQTFSAYLDDFVKQEKTDKATLMNQMRQMYGGYHFSEKTPTDIYNPFSVLNALSEKKFRDYWFSTGTPSFLLKLLQDGDYDLQKFSEGNIKANHLAAKESLRKEPIAMFYQTGYLTIKKHSILFGSYSLGFPNREVEQGFLSFIFPHYMGNTDERTTIFLGDIVHDLREGHIEDFLERMKSFFADTPYELIRDLESHYQNVMFTICRLTGYYTKAEYRTSNGRIDMVVKTEQYIYVFEFKFNKTAKEALKQIDTKEYLLPFRYDGRKLCKIGVNFSKKSRNIDGYEFIWE